MFMWPRSLGSRFVAIGALLALFLLARVTYSNSDRFSNYDLFGSRRTGLCPPEAYNQGAWLRDPSANMSSVRAKEEVLNLNGFEACASSREYWWHLGADSEERLNRFPDVTSWKWTPDNKQCQIQDMAQFNLLSELVEGGGWLLIGDSITEGHFFSLSCSLFPHVRATPDYVANPYWDRAWPQNLYLNPKSPLISHLKLPAGFSIEETPLVTFRRIDALMSEQQLADLHRSLHPEAPPEFKLLSDEQMWSLTPAEYLEIFTAPLPKGNYKTMVVSTAGHWTTTLFAGFKDEAKPGNGIEGVIQFFAQVVEHWSAEMQSALDAHRLETGRERQVVVRAYLPGHEDCHDWKSPWTEIKPFVWNWYNWGSIWEFNREFEKVLSGHSYPNIHWLGIDRPGRLRPDAHVMSDCLHIMAGAGVLEGWTHYIWHFVSTELPARIIR